MSAALCRELHVPPSRTPRLPIGDLDLNGLKGSTFVSAINGSLGEGLRVTLSPDVLVLLVDPDKLPRNCDAARRAVRVFTAIEAPQATAALEKHYGLRLPATIDPRRPLVVLIHGLDSDSDMWGSLAGLLAHDDRQVATFGYPSDGPIDEDADRLAASLFSLRQSYPGLRIDLIAHSMGGLVAREYVEGADYHGGVDRLIMLGTPNGGSGWARWRWMLGVEQQYHLWRTCPDWSFSWIITDGLGEAGGELTPGSKFLKGLNARPRRTGVRYTIVAGNQCPVSEVGADCLARTSGWVPARATHWWGFRQCKAKLDRRASQLRQRTADSDGPVTLKSAALTGVGDFVVVHADHMALACGTPPAAWSVIRDRLAR
jgi:pimeloyl-ACP methyl ester carboxylesterase